MTGATVTEDTVRTVGSSEFDSAVLAAAGPVTVEFMAYSCGHCRALESPLQQVAQVVAPQQRIYRVNVATEPELAARYGVTVTPTLVMFLRGNEISRIEGPPPQVAGLLEAVTLPFRT